MELVSIIVPCFNEQDAIPFFYTEITKLAERMSNKYMLGFEFIFVDDGSTDNTLQILKEYAKQDDRIDFISFTRNFGKEAAMYAGFNKAKGKYIGVMDVDLQDPPELLEEMYIGITKENYDCVASRRVTRKGEPPIRSFFARIFYKLINKISRTEIVDGARDFRLMTRQMLNSLLSLKEYNRFSKGLFGWIGYNTKWLEYENTERVAGETKWSFWKLFLYSLDGIVAFSTAPLAISSIIGIVFCLVAFIMILFVIIKTLIWGDPVAGYPSLISAILLTGGFNLFCLGIIGQYFSKMYLEVKDRPIYLIKEEK